MAAHLSRFFQVTRMNIFLLDICLLWACASATPQSSSFDNDLQWRSIDLNQDGKPDSPKDSWIIAVRSSAVQVINGFESGKSKNGLISLPYAANFSRQNKPDLSRVKWAHGVNRKIQLNDSLRGNAMMIEADVSMGTIAGGDGTAFPVMAHPPLNTSDLSLKEFLDTIHHSNTSKGIKLDFKGLEVVEPSLIIIKSRANEMAGPLWLNADILSGPVDASTEPVDAARFLKLAKRYFPDAVLSVGWTTRFGPQLTLPLQIINEGSYTMDHMVHMRDVLKAAAIQQPVTFPIRAGLSTSPEAQESILWLLEQFENSSLTIWSSQYDTVDVPRLMEFVSHIGKENIYFDVPSGLNCEIQHFEE